MVAQCGCLLTSGHALSVNRNAYCKWMKTLILVTLFYYMHMYFMYRFTPIDPSICFSLVHQHFAFFFVYLFWSLADTRCCESRSAHSQVSLCAKIKSLPFTLVIPLLIQDQPYTPNYWPIHPFHTALLTSFIITEPARWKAEWTSSLRRETAVWE